MQKTGLALAGTAETETEELKSGFLPIHLEFFFSPLHELDTTLHHGVQVSPPQEEKLSRTHRSQELNLLLSLSPFCHPSPRVDCGSTGEEKKSFWLFYRDLDHDVRPAPPHAETLSLFWSLDPPLGFYLSAGVWVRWRTT